MFTAIVSVTILVTLAQAPQPKDKDADDAVQLVVKAKDFMIHAIGASARPEKALPATPAELGNEIVLVHTSTATGKMKILFRNSRRISMGQPMGIRYYLTESGLTDFRVDKERLYVLQYSATTVGGLTIGLEMIPTRSDLSKSTYRLLVFKIDDGTLHHAIDLKSPEKVPVAKTDKGPLSLRENGVEVFGARFEFDGTALIKPAAKDKK